MLCSIHIKHQVIHCCYQKACPGWLKYANFGPDLQPSLTIMRLTRLGLLMSARDHCYWTGEGFQSDPMFIGFCHGSWGWTCRTHQRDEAQQGLTTGSYFVIHNITHLLVKVSNKMSELVEIDFFVGFKQQPHRPKLVLLFYLLAGKRQCTDSCFIGFIFYQCCPYHWSQQIHKHANMQSSKIRNHCRVFISPCL